MPSSQDPNSFDLTSVNTSFTVAGGSKRAPALISVKPSGYAFTDLEGTLLFATYLSTEGISRENLKVYYGANPNTGFIGIYIDRTGLHPGAMAVRDGDTVLYFHLGGVFKEYSNLRPTGNVECGITFGKDAKGVPCFVFNILKGVAKRSRRKPKDGAKKVAPPDTKSGTEAETQPAAGQQGQAKPAPEAEAEE